MTAMHLHPRFCRQCRRPLDPDDLFGDECCYCDDDEYDLELIDDEVWPEMDWRTRYGTPTTQQHRPAILADDDDAWTPVPVPHNENPWGWWKAAHEKRLAAIKALNT